MASRKASWPDDIDREYHSGGDRARWYRPPTGRIARLTYNEFRLLTYMWAEQKRRNRYFRDLKHGKTPTVKECAEHLGVSGQQVNNMHKTLASRGYVYRLDPDKRGAPGKRRNLLGRWKVSKAGKLALALNDERPVLIIVDNCVTAWWGAGWDLRDQDYIDGSVRRIKARLDRKGLDIRDCRLRRNRRWVWVEFFTTDWEGGMPPPKTFVLGHKQKRYTQLDEYGERIPPTSPEPEDTGK